MARSVSSAVVARCARPATTGRAATQQRLAAPRYERVVKATLPAFLGALEGGGSQRDILALRRRFFSDRRDDREALTIPMVTRPGQREHSHGSRHRNSRTGRAGHTRHAADNADRRGAPGARVAACGDIRVDSGGPVRDGLRQRRRG